MVTPKQEKFLKEYLIDGNATQAAIRAGYSPKTAKEQGSRLLTNVDIKKRLRELRATTSQRLQLSADVVVEKYQAVMNFSIADLYHEGKIISVDDWSDIAKIAVKEIEFDATGRLRSAKFESKLSAMRALGEYLGIFTDMNKAIASLKLYGINLKQDANNRWTVEEVDV